MAAAGSEVAAGAGGVAETGEDDRADHLVVIALELGLRLDVLYNRADLAVLPSPGGDVRWVELGDNCANVVPPYGDDGDLLRIPSSLLEDHHQVPAWLQERSGDVVPAASIRSLSHLSVSGTWTDSVQ